MSHLYDVIKECDDFIAICGEYWYKNSRSKFKSWKKKITQIDLGLDVTLYPNIKKNLIKLIKENFYI